MMLRRVFKEVDVIDIRYTGDVLTVDRAIDTIKASISIAYVSVNKADEIPQLQRTIFSLNVYVYMRDDIEARAGAPTEGKYLSIGCHLSSLANNGMSVGYLSWR